MTQDNMSGEIFTGMTVVFFTGFGFFFVLFYDNHSFDVKRLLIISQEHIYWLLFKWV